MDLLESIVERFDKQRREKPFCSRFQKWSRKQLKPLVKRFVRRGDADLTDLAKLHKFRIASKRLRYGLELVWGSLDKRLRKRAYKQLDRLQMQLGSINDTHNLIVEIDHALQAVKKRTLQAQLRRLLSTEQRRLTTAQALWVENWSGKKARRLERTLKQLV